MSQLAVYFHIPFCRRRCRYCGFTSFEGKESLIGDYVRAVETEMSLRSVSGAAQSVYFGGGTPSLLKPEDIGTLLKTTREYNRFAPDIEITLEINPGTVNYEYLKALNENGVNRLSIGMQSLLESDLIYLGRTHSAREARRALENARSADFANINLDFIIGVPGRSLNDWREILRDALNLEPEHLSLYPLSIEEGTPLKRAIEAGDAVPPDADAAADEYETAEFMLAEAGYRHYEIANWAKPGFESRHNLAYWQGTEYIGYGVAAHSYLKNRRTANTCQLGSYLEALNAGQLPLLEVDEIIDEMLAQSEAIILNLRLADGVSLDDIWCRFGIDLLAAYAQDLAELEEAALVEVRDRRLKLTARGRLLANEVFLRFLPDNHDRPATYS